MHKALILKILCLLLTAGNLAANHNRRTPIVEAYKSAENSIVNISGKQLVTRRSQSMMDFYNFFGPQRQRQTLQRFELGSGFVVHRDGYIVTNAHVIKTSDSLSVTFINGKEYEAKLISADETKDLAFLKIDSDEKFEAIRLGTSCDIMIGETVIAVGNPFGYSNSVTDGIVSAIGRDIHVQDDFWLRGLIQTSAPINPGNSGGPLLNINGELIGINTAIRQQAQNIGFAIPVDTLTNNLIEMLMPEKLRRVRLGIVIGKMGCAEDGKIEGLEITSVAEDSPARRQGIMRGDLITKIDGSELENFIDFYVKIIDKDVGGDIELECFRPSSGDSHTFNLVLEHRPLPDGKQIFSRFFQMAINELNEQVARQFDFDKSYPMLIITDISTGGVGASAGIRAGDIVISINSSLVENVRDLSVEMEKIKEGDTITLEILRIGRWGGSQVQRRYRVVLEAKQYADVKDKVVL